MNWTKDPVTREHQLVTTDGFYAVVRSGGGDWYAGFQEHDEFWLQDIEYFDTWQQARKWCELKLKEQDK